VAVRMYYLRSKELSNGITTKHGRIGARP